MTPRTGFDAYLAREVDRYMADELDDAETVEPLDCENDEGVCDQFWSPA